MDFSGWVQWRWCLHCWLWWCLINTSPSTRHVASVKRLDLLNLLSLLLFLSLGLLSHFAQLSLNALFFPSLLLISEALGFLVTFFLGLDLLLECLG
jgi:hypothetical protein